MSNKLAKNITDSTDQQTIAYYTKWANDWPDALDDAIDNIVSLWNDEVKDDPYWIIDPDGELRSIGCDGFDECRDEILEHFDYEFPDIEELIEEFQLEGVVP